MMLNTAAERRLYTRVETVLPVKIFYNDVFVERCNTINIGVGGLLIATRDVAFTENSLIQVQFDIDLTDSLGQTLIPAIVCRSGYNQMAVSFERLEKGIEDYINAN